MKLHNGTFIPQNCNIKPEGLAVEFVTYLPFEYMPAPNLHGLKNRNHLYLNMQLDMNLIPRANYHIC